MTWEVFLTTFLGSGASFAVLTLWFDHLRHRQQRQESAGFLALQIAFLYEGYASQCADAVGEHDTSVASQGTAGTSIDAVPKTPPLPESDAYKLLDKRLLHDVMEFPQRRDLAQQAAWSEGEHGPDEDDYKRAVAENTVLIGERALDIARRLRSVHKQPARDFTFGDDYNLETYFRDKAAEVAETKRKREERNRKANVELAATLGLSEKDA